jgi:hypothetical protein
MEAIGALYFWQGRRIAEEYVSEKFMEKFKGILKFIFSRSQRLLVIYKTLSTK